MSAKLMNKLIKMIIAVALLGNFLQVKVSFSAGENSFPRYINDMSKISVYLEKKPARIVSLAPSITEILFSLGLGEKVVAVSGASNYPPEAKKKLNVGDIFLNYEKIVSLNPDLVIIEETINKRDILKLRNLKLPLVVIRSDTYDNFIESALLVGKSTGFEEEAELRLKELQSNMNLIANLVKSIPYKDRPRVFVEIWNKPMMTAGKDTFINYIIENAGGINVAGDMSGYPQVNAEMLLLKNPDVIILTTSTQKEFLSSAYWRKLKAARCNRIHVINPDILARPTLRLFDSCKTLFRWFYPDMKLSPDLLKKFYSKGEAGCR